MIQRLAMKDLKISHSQQKKNPTVGDKGFKDFVLTTKKKLSTVADEGFEDFIFTTKKSATVVDVGFEDLNLQRTTHKVMFKDITTIQQDIYIYIVEFCKDYEVITRCK